MTENITSQRTFQFIFFLPVPTDMFCANGYESGPTLYSPTDGEMFIFPTEIVDRLDSYDNVTGENIKHRHIFADIEKMMILIVL